MQHCIKICDLDEAHALKFDLADLLKVLPDRAKSLVWRVEHIEARWKTTEPEIVRRVQRSVQKREAPHLTWSELLRVAGAIFQTTNARVSARPDDGSEPVLALEAVDSSYWLIEAEHRELLEAFGAAFQRVGRCD